jgi:hypothetical protein
LEWSAPEFITYQRDWRWFLSAAAALFAVGVYSAFVRDWFMIFIVFFLAVALYLNQQRTPKEITYRITQKGLYLDDKFFQFDQIHSFWIVLNGGQKVLNIVFNNKFLPALTINFDAIDPENLKTILTKYIPEQVDRGESLADKLSRILKI